MLPSSYPMEPKPEGSVAEYEDKLKHHLKLNGRCGQEVGLQGIRRFVRHTWPQIPLGYPGGSDSKESACNAGDPGLIHGLRRSSGEGNGNPLQYSCLENSMHREAWWATVHTVAELDTSGYLFRSLEGFFSPFYLSCRIYCTSHLYFLIL